MEAFHAPDWVPTGAGMVTPRGGPKAQCQNVIEDGEWWHPETIQQIFTRHLLQLHSIIH
jgi:hypothetical protein